MRKKRKSPLTGRSYKSASKKAPWGYRIGTKIPRAKPGRKAATKRGKKSRP